jgi:uncharacterized protein
MLEKLQSEIKNAETLDAHQRELLLSLERDIEALLAETGEAQAQPEPSFLERLTEAQQHFEISHPSLTLAIGHVLDVLSQMGI